MQGEASADKVKETSQIDSRNKTKQFTGVYDDTDCLGDARRVHM